MATNSDLTPDKDKLVWCLNDLEEQPIDWLWPGRLPAGKLTLIDGDPSQGKSLMTLDLAGRLTAAQPLPDGFTAPQPQSVVLVGHEDGIRDTVLPRLRAAGADLRRVHAFAGRAKGALWSGLPSLPDDCDLLTQTLEDTGARLVIVDPLMAFLSSRVSSLNDQMVRQALGPLAQVAAEKHVAILLVRHLTKGGRGDSALYRGMGSIALIGVARMAYLVATSASDEDVHVLACTKSNLAIPPPSLGFRIGTSDQGQPVIHWTGAVDMSADDLVLAPRMVFGEMVTRAKEFLLEQLRAGPRPSVDMLQAARAAGFSETTLKRARALLAVVAEEKRVDGRNCWYWRLRDAEADDDSLSWPEQHQRALAQAQKESDKLMARIRAKYGNQPVTTHTPLP